MRTAGLGESSRDETISKLTDVTIDNARKKPDEASIDPIGELMTQLRVA